MSMPCLRWIPACAAGLLVAAAHAASPTDLPPAPSQSGVRSLAEHFEAAWARQPEAQSLESLRGATEAQRRAAAAWTPSPPTLELAERKDRGATASGFRERELGVAVPLWWPGERAGAQVLAEAAAAGIESRHGLARLRLAGELREAWWRWQQARVAAELAADRHTRALTLAADVTRRVAAGDLAPVDQLQADAAVAAADAERAEAAAELAATAAALQALSGTRPELASAASDEPADATVARFAAETASSRGATRRGDLDPTTEPEPEPATVDLAGHPQLVEARDQLRAAKGAAALATAQRGEHPELRLVATREREARFGPEAESLTLGLSLPLGGGAERRERIGRAEAAVGEARARLALTLAQLEAARTAAEARVRAARLQRTAHETRARLAAQALAVQQAAFEAGEADLPTRLRAEAEAAEADLAAAQARIAEAAAISAWRQALGLLPQ